MDTVQPNEKSHDLDNQRQKSLSDFVKKKKFGQDESESEENSEKSEEKLDNDQNNSYINNEDNNDEKDIIRNEEQESSSEQQNNEEEQSSNDDELTKYEKILKDQFSGDGKKAVKSWREGQKEYGKLRRKFKQEQEKLNYIDKVVQENPVLGELFKKGLQQGKVTKNDLQSFLSGDNQEPSGKPTNTSSESKLENIDNGFDVNDIDENTLAESGYIDLKKKDTLSPSEWSILKRQAAVNYAEDKLPERLANQAYSKFQKQIDAEKKQREKQKRQQKNRQINEERYEKGLDQVVDEFGLDFAGNEDHEAMLDEIEQLATNIRDPQNNSVIHEDAIYLATQQVMRRKGMQPSKSVNVDEEVDKAEQQANESFDKRTGFNANTKKTGGSNKPKTLAEKMAQRHVSEYQKEHEKRVKTGRVSSD